MWNNVYAERPEGIYLTSTSGQSTKGVRDMKVKLEENCWLADWEGDPGRTIVE